jgi:hypothetical protein
MKTLSPRRVEGRDEESSSLLAVIKHVLTTDDGRVLLRELLGPVFVSKETAGSLLGLSPWQFYRWAEREQVVRVKMAGGTALRYSLASICAKLEEGCLGSRMDREMVFGRLADHAREITRGIDPRTIEFPVRGHRMEGAA